MRRPIFAFLLLMFCLVAGANGQGTTSRVTGTVQDANGAAVAGAMVTLTNDATSISFATETSDSGTYAFDLVQVGKYTVTIEKRGFKKFISQSNTVNVNQPTTINATLETGGLTETVTVQAGAEQVQTSTSGNIGSTIEQKTLEALPIVGTRGRNPLDLLNFQPGVVIGGNTGGSIGATCSRALTLTSCRSVKAGSSSPACQQSSTTSLVDGRQRGRCSGCLEDRSPFTRVSTR